MVDNKNSSFR